MGRNRQPGKWGFAGILPLILLAVLIVIPLLLIFLTSIRTEEGGISPPPSGLSPPAIWVASTPIPFGWGSVSSREPLFWLCPWPG